MRARMVHPDFFSDRTLCSLPDKARILFIGLWCLSDKQGRSRNITKLISAEVFPHETVEVEPLIELLAEHKFIVLYEVSGEPLIWVVNFAKYQRCHHQEKASKLPPPPPEILQRFSAEFPETLSPTSGESRLLTGTGTGTGTVDLPDSDLSEHAARMVSRHPKPERAGNPVTVGQALSQILANSVDPAKEATLIEANHQAWSSSPQWTESDGKFCPSLLRWIRERNCFDTPPKQQQSEYRNITNEKGGL